MFKEFIEHPWRNVRSTMQKNFLMKLWRNFRKIMGEFLKQSMKYFLEESQ